MLPKEAVEEFKILYKKIFKIELSDEEASFRANNLIDLYKLTYSQSDLVEIKDKRKNETKKF